MNAALAYARKHLAVVAGCAGLTLVGFALFGCESFGGGRQTAGQGPPASPKEHPLLENLPLPVGFRMVPERSVARTSGRMRVAQCEFEGKYTPEEVTRFYLDYMPSATFILKQKRFDNGEYNLRFESETEECNIRTRRGKTATVLVVDIGPLPKGSAEREVKPSLPQP